VARATEPARTDSLDIGPALRSCVLEAYDGVVYDLDGTLVHLDVAWDDVRADVAATYRDAGVDPGDRDLWALFGAAGENGLGEAVEAAMAAHERDGARVSRRLRLADALADERRPVGVCTLNSEGAARIALETHDLAAHVDAVVGRDTVPEHKPHPGPLLETVDLLGVDPADVVFVGDSVRDEETASAAGTAFAYVRDLVDD
jgi:HAD superfamily hydrolase (TIGR01509 family)